jgi:hypothetical protein
MPSERAKSAEARDLESADLHNLFLLGAPVVLVSSPDIDLVDLDARATACVNRVGLKL